MGRKAGLSQSKISKIETGCTRFNNKNIQNILDILGAPKTIRQQINLQIEQIADDPMSQRHYGFFMDLTTVQYERECSTLRSFAIQAIPLILQILEYRNAIIKRYGRRNEPEIDIDMRTTLQRQDLLWDKKRSFHIILHQAALYTHLAGKGVQIMQLDRLERLLGRENIKIGIIPTKAGLPVLDPTNFVLYDDRQLLTATGKGEVISLKPADILLHMTLFKELDQLALYGNEAKGLIREAIDYFS